MPSVILAALVFVVAMLYGSVGHGGASGYLALLSLLGYSALEMSTSALVLNLSVATLAFLQFWRRGYFSWKITWPFLVTSLPAALWGGGFRIAPGIYEYLLATVLLWAAFRLWMKPPEEAIVSRGGPSLWMALPAGAGIGFVSGVVGIGGGIFLSPLLLLRRLAGVKQTAATAAAFVALNSFAGLIGRWISSRLETGTSLFLIIPALAGGWIGSWAGSERLSSRWLCRLLAGVLGIAAGKLVLCTTERWVR